MPLPSDIGVSFRVRTPSVYERGRAQTVRMEARLGSALVAPTAGTFTLRSPTGAVVSTSAVVVSGDIATATVPALDLPTTLGYGDGYTEEWDLTISSVVRTARREAYLCRRALHCPVTQADLEARHPRIAAAFGNVADLQAFIDEAWSDTLRRLLSDGRWPEEVVEVSSLRGYVREMALAYTFSGLMTGTPSGTADRYTSLAEQAREAARQEWARIRFRRDSDQDGVADAESRSPASRIVSRGVAGERGWWGGYRGRRVL